MQENFPSLNFLHMEDFYTYLYADLHNIMEYKFALLWGEAQKRIAYSLL